MHPTVARGSARFTLLAVTLCTGCADATPETVGVGVIASANFIHAAEIAFEDELAEGMIPGLDTAFIGEGTNRSEPALRYAEQLAARPGMLAVIGHSNSASSIAASQVYNRMEVVQIAPTSTATLYREAGPYSFRMVATDDEQARFLAAVLTDSLDAGARLAILYVNDDYGRGLHRSLISSLEETELETVLEIPHQESGPEPMDLGYLRQALSGSMPDAIVWLGRYYSLDYAIASIRQALGDVPVFASDGVSAAVVNMAGSFDPDWTGVHIVDLLSDEPSAALVRFQEAFRARHDRAASSSEALTYDAVRLVLTAIREGIRDSEELRDYLNALGDRRPPYPGITGPIQFNEYGDGPGSFHLTTYSPDPFAE